MNNNWFIYQDEDNNHYIEEDITALSDTDLIIEDNLTREEARRALLELRFSR